MRHKIVLSAKTKEAVTAYLLITPSLALFLVIGLFTVLFSIVLSLFHLMQGSLIQNANFAGLNNYKAFLYSDLILSSLFRRALLTNLIIAFALVLFVIPIALMLAVLLKKLKKFSGFFRSVFFMPAVTSSVAIFYVWMGLYDVDGMINQVLNLVGLTGLVSVNGWLGDTSTALAAIIVILVWSGTPVIMVLYSAGLETIDASLYESAQIDGAGFLQKMVHITWPCLRPITMIAVVLILSGAMQVFDLIWVMTKGGPAGSTMVVNMLVYKEAFMGGDMGKANAMAWVVAIISFILSIVSMKLLNEKEAK